MADIMKHVGKYGDKPCVVVFRELPEEADQALIVVSDSLEGQLHDDIMSVVDSPEGQESNNISEVLFRRRATDGSNLLETLHNNQKLMKVPVDMVKLTPMPNQEVELSDVNAELGKIETGSNPPLKTENIVEGDGVVVVLFVLVVVASRIGEFVVGDVDDAVGCAVCCWREGGGINGAGDSVPVGE